MSSTTIDIHLPDVPPTQPAGQFGMYSKQGEPPLAQVPRTTRTVGKSVSKRIIVPGNIERSVLTAQAIMDRDGKIARARHKAATDKARKAKEKRKARR